MYYIKVSLLISSSSFILHLLNSIISKSLILFSMARQNICRKHVKISKPLLLEKQWTPMTSAIACQTCNKLNLKIDFYDPIILMQIIAWLTQGCIMFLTQWAVYKRTPHLGSCKSFLIQTLSHTRGPSNCKYQNNYHTLSCLHKLNKAMICSLVLLSWEGNNLENTGN
jgi:hypothetical protein